ncbi:MAG: Cache 3/Cache 2 fusion domain-containing protein [Dokdonella sp.]
MLPVTAIAVVLILAGAIGFSIFAKAHEEATIRREIDEKVAAIQDVFVTAAAVMGDRSRAAMAVLNDQIQRRGAVARGGEVSFGDAKVHDILIGGKGQARDYAIVDATAQLNGGTATLFSKEGETFTRISTNVKKDDGTRAIGTQLDATTRAYAAVSKLEAFYGVVKILGLPYFTGYEPLYDEDHHPIGLAYVGFKAELPVLSNALEQSRLLGSGFVAVADDKTIRYLPSWTNAQQVAAIIENPGTEWAITRTPLPEWGFTIVAAYPVAELDSLGARIGYGVIAGGLLLAALIAVALFFLLDRKVLQLLGGEPQVAADYMRKIASGDLGIDIAVAHGDQTSLMASLKIMQLKLKNIVNSIQGHSAELGEQAKRFEVTATGFMQKRDESTMRDLIRMLGQMTKTVAMLGQSMGRFKM